MVEFKIKLWLAVRKHIINWTQNLVFIGSKDIFEY